MNAWGIIGGTVPASLPWLERAQPRNVETPYGPPSGPLHVGQAPAGTVIALARHGEPPTIPPHGVNYRANVHALHALGVQRVVAINAVGAIDAKLAPGSVALPQQLIDYTWGRAHTFFDGAAAPEHVEFTEPYSHTLIGLLAAAADEAGVDLRVGGVYAATQGPRLETAAEIDRLERDGCTMVGMTGMPEAALARELGMDYACCAVVVNMAAGRGDGGMHDQIAQSIGTGQQRVERLLRALLKQAP